MRYRQLLLSRDPEARGGNKSILHLPPCRKAREAAAVFSKANQSHSELNPPAKSCRCYKHLLRFRPCTHRRAKQETSSPCTEDICSNINKTRKKYLKS